MKFQAGELAIVDLRLLGESYCENKSVALILSIIPLRRLYSFGYEKYVIYVPKTGHQYTLYEDEMEKVEQ